MEQTFYMIYPEVRHVTATWIKQRYEDYCADGRIDEDYLGTDDPNIMAQALEDAGLFTFGQEPDRQERFETALHEKADYDYRMSLED